MPSHYDVLPDLAFGHHPVHGIVAANPKNLAASSWMLKGFDFHPVPDQPTLYALADQNRDGHGRTSRAIELLRKAGYQVDVDAALDPALAPDTEQVRDRGPLGEPDVAFADHPQLGIVAALDDRASGLSGLALVEDGWRYDSSLDIYTLPATTDRVGALGRHGGPPPFGAARRGAAPPRSRGDGPAPPCCNADRCAGARPWSCSRVSVERRRARRQPGPCRYPGQGAGPRRRHHTGGPAG
ncbi:hypothetical protein [Streptomyces sp. PpalLS-921]|uniref:hypothetical protein n=1 Tax=Streptomyces sp. PpalLS-921 TaxID=1839772 RepID=UPI00081EA92A|nr:hypothetical protein [Streptomyces sp. PpalLS-921]SCD72706.1 hypothetical protein GA0115249_107788 [Streptomyces sp. PpalLS-921]